MIGSQGLTFTTPRVKIWQSSFAEVIVKSLLGVIVAVLTLVSLSCNQADLTGPKGTKSSASIKMGLSMKGAPSDVASIFGVLSRPGYDTLRSQFVISSISDSAVCQFTDVAAGQWYLVVNALDASGTIKYSGAAYVNVIGGETTFVNLVLSATTGSISVVVTWGASGQTSNESLDFDGYSGYVDVPDSPSLTDIDSAYTLEAWIKPEGDAMYNYIIAKGVPDLQYTMELLSPQLNPAFTLDGGVTIDYTGASDYWSRLVLSNTVPANSWTHLAVTYRDGYGIDVYLNGQLVHHAYASGLLTPVSGNLRLGVLLNDTYQLYFKGLLDNVSIWKTALTASQIQDNMRTALTGSESNLVAYWDFNDSLGSRTVHDKSPNHNDGRLVGGVSFSTDTPF